MMTSPDPDSASSLNPSLPSEESNSLSLNQLEAQVPFPPASASESHASLHILSQTALSDYESDIDRQSIRSMSVASSSRDYPFENGRRYHKFREGSYAFPNDESEQERENLKHAMILKLCGGRLHFAPVGKYAEGAEGAELHNIIDLGTGTGIWCIEMGDEYPSALILGIDLSPIQPVWVPPNVNFMVDDAESDWLEPEDFYDLVHARHVTQAIKDFPTLLQRAYRHIKPGGWIELQEMHHLPHSASSLALPPNYPLLKFFQLAVQGLAKLGNNLNASLSEAACLGKYGFTNIRHEVLRIPIGTWPEEERLKTVGMYARCGIEGGLQAMAYGPLCRGLGWSKDSVESFLEDVRKCLRDTDEGEGPGVRAYLPFHVWYGQKPIDTRSENNVTNEIMDDEAMSME